MTPPPGEIEVDVVFYGIPLKLHGIFERGRPATLVDPGYGDEFIMSAAYHKDEDILYLLSAKIRSDLEDEAVKLLEN